MEPFVGLDNDRHRPDGQIRHYQMSKPETEPTSSEIQDNLQTMFEHLSDFFAEIVPKITKVLNALFQCGEGMEGCRSYIV